MLRRTTARRSSVSSNNQLNQWCRIGRRLSSWKTRLVPQAVLSLSSSARANSRPADSYIISIPPPRERTTTTPRKEREKDSKHTTPSNKSGDRNDQPTSKAQPSDDSPAWLSEERADSLDLVSSTTTSNDAQSSGEPVNRPATPPSTPRKKIGRLGYDGRQWTKGYNSPTKVKPWREV